MCRHDKLEQSYSNHNKGYYYLTEAIFLYSWTKNNIFHNLIPIGFLEFTQSTSNISWVNESKKTPVEENTRNKNNGIWKHNISMHQNRACTGRSGTAGQTKPTGWKNLWQHTNRYRKWTTFPINENSYVQLCTTSDTISLEENSSQSADIISRSYFVIACNEILSGKVTYTKVLLSWEISKTID